MSQAAPGYVLYGARGSGSAAVEMALVQAGQSFRKVNAASWEDNAGRDELARVNPLQQIPTLVLPDGSVLTESAAILIHLGLVHPQSKLLPAAASARAQVMRGLVYIAANCYAAIGLVDYPERWVSEPDAPTGERIRKGTRQRLHYLWDVFADTFPATPYLGGEACGALDLLAAVVSRWSGARAHLAQTRPLLAALFERIEADPRFAPIFATYWPPKA